MTAVQTSRSEQGRARRLKAALVLALGLVGLVVGLVVASLQPTRYESTARLLIGPIGGARETLDAAGLLSTTYADLIQSRAVVARVSADLDVAVDPDDVRATADERSRVILVTVEDDEATVPAAVADALADELITLVEDSGTPAPADPTLETPAQVQVLDEATEAERVRNPTVVIVVVATVLGLAVGWQIARVVNPAGARIDEDFVRDDLGLPHVAVHSRVMSTAVPEDAWDLIAAQLDHQTGWGEQARVIAFVPVDDEVDMTDALLHLACAYARSETSIALCDADAHLSLLEPHLEGAMSAWVQGRVDIVDNVVTPYRSDDSSLLLRTPGRFHVVTTAGPELASNSVARLHEIVRNSGGTDRVAVLCPPISASPVAATAGLVVDRVVLVVRTGRSEVAEARRTAEALQTVGVEAVAVLEIDGSFHPTPVGLRLHRPVRPDVESIAEPAPVWDPPTAGRPGDGGAEESAEIGT